MANSIFRLVAVDFNKLSTLEFWNPKHKATMIFFVQVTRVSYNPPEDFMNSHEGVPHGRECGISKWPEGKRWNTKHLHQTQETITFRDMLGNSQTVTEEWYQQLRATPRFAFHLGMTGNFVFSPPNQGRPGSSFRVDHRKSYDDRTSENHNYSSNYIQKSHELRYKRNDSILHPHSTSWFIRNPTKGAIVYTL